LTLADGNSVEALTTSHAQVCSNIEKKSVSSDIAKLCSMGETLNLK
jgi:hypothetical protein